MRLVEQVYHDNKLDIEKFNSLKEYKGVTAYVDMNALSL